MSNFKRKVNRNKKSMVSSKIVNNNVFVEKNIDYKSVNNFSIKFSEYLNSIPNINHHTISENSEVYGYCMCDYHFLYIVGFDNISNMFFGFYKSAYGEFFGYFDLEFVIESYETIRIENCILDIVGKIELENLLNKNNNIQIPYENRSECMRKLSNIYSGLSGYGSISQSVLNMNVLFQKREMNYTYKNNQHYMDMDYKSSYIFVKSLNEFYKACSFDTDRNIRQFDSCNPLWIIGLMLIAKYNISNDMDLN